MTDKILTKLENKNERERLYEIVCPGGNSFFCDGTVNKSKAKRGTFPKGVCIYLKKGRCTNPVCLAIDEKEFAVDYDRKSL